MMIFVWIIFLFIFIYWVGPIIDKFKEIDYMTFVTLYITCSIIFWKYLTKTEIDFFLQLSVIYLYMFSCYFFNENIVQRIEEEEEE